MCGIAGYIDLRERGRIDPRMVEAMTETLVHRGPDSSGYFIEPNVGLGVKRLKILDLETGDQPIYNEDASVVLVVSSLPSGHCLIVEEGSVRVREYWDLDYPEEDDGPELPEESYIEELCEAFRRSVQRRLQSDVPLGLFLSGGIDSSLVSAVAVALSNGTRRDSFSVVFDSAEIDEARYQRLVTNTLGCRHHEIRIDDEAIVRRLHEMVYHCECPVKETFNTCSLALAEAAREARVKVVLGGEGADELFAGYVGYRFDAAAEGFRLHPHLETDLLMIVLTFNLFLEAFELPDLTDC